MNNERKVLDHGFVKLLNLSGPVRRPDEEFDASDRDPAITARISFDNMEQERTEDQDHKLLKYLMNNKHTSPLEFVEIWVEFKLPLFVARQTMRHRTFVYNEISGRYAKLPEEFYIPELVGGKGGSNKQGQVDNLPSREQEWFKEALHSQCSSSYAMYEEALDKGVANEHARLFLHLNNYTRYVCKANLPNWLHFLSLRLHEHAQVETRQYAKAVYELIKQHLPESMKCFEDYRLK